MLELAEQVFYVCLTVIMLSGTLYIEKVIVELFRDGRDDD